MMGDVAKGIKAFKKGMADDDTAPAASSPVAQPGSEPVRTIEHQSAAGAPSPATSEHKIG
jgi:sec-independent protein translocase protein TatA